MSAWPCLQRAPAHGGVEDPLVWSPKPGQVAHGPVLMSPWMEPCCGAAPVQTWAPTRNYMTQETVGACWGILEQPGRVEDVPAHGGGWNEIFRVPWNPNRFVIPGSNLDASCMLHIVVSPAKHRCPPSPAPRGPMSSRSVKICADLCQACQAPSPPPPLENKRWLFLPSGTKATR